ncbi:MAG: hypothetical protein IJO48_00670 [Clostridia bacterium]|nr:hypothetical protein [Clostridia bacterium]
MKKITALFLAMMMLVCFTACDNSGNEENNNDSQVPTADSVMIKVGDYEVTFGELNDVYNYYYEIYVAYGMLDPENETEVEEFKQTIIDYQLENILPAFAADKLGIELNNEEKAKLDETYESQLNMYLSQFADQIDTSVTDPLLIKEAQIALFRDSLAESGIDYDEFMADQKEDMRLSLLSNKMLEETVGEATVTEDEVKTAYDTKVAEFEKEYDANVVGYYERYQEMVAGTGKLPYYAPEGYYYVTYIYIDDKSEDIRDYDAEALVAEVQGKVDALMAETDVEKRIEGFKALIKEYGQDDVLEMDPFATDGFLVHNDMTDEYYEEFLNAVRNLEKKGDISAQVKTENGTQIIIRLENVTAGATPYENVREEIKEELLTEKQTALHNAAMEEWKELVKPEIKTEYAAYFGMTLEATPMPEMTGGC